MAVLRQALAALPRHGVAPQAISSLYRTAPRDLVDQPVFVNAAIRANFDGTPVELLAVVKRIERDLGRRPGRRFGPRVIDIDILLWEGGGWHDAALTVPHERLHERRFALVPLVEIDPDLSLPDGRLLSALATELAVDPGQSVELCPDVTLRD